MTSNDRRDPATNLDHSVQMSGLHLPDVDGPVAALDQQEVVQRSPLDADDGKDVPRRQHDAASLLQRQQRHRVVASDAAHAVTDAGRDPWWRDVETEHLNRETRLAF